MNRSGMKCVLYPRVSTEMQVDGFSVNGIIKPAVFGSEKPAVF